LHKLNRELEVLNKTYDKNSILKDRAFGKNRLKYIANEGALLQAQAKNYEESWIKA
jgi:hypothetical protein